MEFEWDEEKEQINIAKHGIDFTTAARVFNDDNRLEIYDDYHCYGSVHRTRRRNTTDFSKESDQTGKEKIL